MRRSDRLPTEISTDGLMFREQPTYFQRVLMLEALHCLHRTALERGVPVVHIFIPTTPEWYVDQVSALVRASADSTGCAVANTGAIPPPDAFVGSLTNPHSGKHFSPEFNRYWAEAIAQWLYDNQVFADRRAQ